MVNYTPNSSSSSWENKLHERLPESQDYWNSLKISCKVTMAPKVFWELSEGNAFSKTHLTENVFTLYVSCNPKLYYRDADCKV